jgi:hypothetical protein
MGDEGGNERFVTEGTICLKHLGKGWKVIVNPTPGYEIKEGDRFSTVFVNEQVNRIRRAVVCASDFELSLDSELSPDDSEKIFAILQESALGNIRVRLWVEAPNERGLKVVGVSVPAPIATTR